ncbi:MAG: hypothetical protein RLY20_1329 [Verrucomicrobiota bacterium]
MNTWNSQTTTLADVPPETAAPTALTRRCPSKSLYVAPPRFDVEGWIFVSLLAAFTAALAVLILAR